ncbi:phage morphogenesis protein [Chryseobacterium indologenes]|uniref:phage morphogenesis protein n=1 Tax=Chryseobacterium indologenes TaxID=253 RepID=UPI001D0D1ACB|nr:phage morphogenesis protein [Chryseobacterium indologenes]UDQ55009.1 phage morphogenesis protein [Chryseobacterium indologenes]
MADLRDFQNLLNRASRELPDKLPRIIEVEGLNFIKMNFRKQGYTDTSFTKWQERKKKDSSGRDITRYRTDRVGRRGELNKYGQREQGRAILVGHRTGGNKLINSFRARRSRQRVVFYTYKNYASIHNEGDAKIPKRQFFGKSAYLDRKIQEKVTREMDRIMRG